MQLKGYTSHLLHKLVASWQQGGNVLAQWTVEARTPCSTNCKTIHLDGVPAIHDYSMTTCG